MASSLSPIPTTECWSYDRLSMEMALTEEQQQLLIAHSNGPLQLYNHIKVKLAEAAMLNRRLSRVRQQKTRISTDQDSIDDNDSLLNSISPSPTSIDSISSTTNRDVEEESKHLLSEWCYLYCCISELLKLNNQNVSYHLLAIQIYQSSHPCCGSLGISPSLSSHRLNLALSSCDTGIDLCIRHLRGHHNSFYIWIATFYMLRAQILFQEREWRRVIDSISAALQFPASDIIHLLYNLRASAYCELKQFKKAISDYGEAIARTEESSSYHNSRGTCYHELGQYDDALNDYNLAIASNAQCVSAYNNRSSLFVDMKEYEKALNDANFGLGIYPNHGNLYKHRGEAHFYLRNYKECLLDLQKSIRLTPKYRPARVTLKMVWNFYYQHLMHYVQSDMCRVIVDYVVGDNYQIEDDMVDATYADWKKEMDFENAEKERQSVQQQEEGHRESAIAIADDQEEETDVETGGDVDGDCDDQDHGDGDDIEMEMMMERSLLND